MKNALFTDTLRRIKKTRGRFFAIMAIIAIGCGFFAGVKVTSPDMKHTADLYYKENNLMDIRLVSTFGFTDEEIQAIARTDSEISGICGGYSSDMFIKMDDGTSPVTRVYSANTDAINSDSPDYISHFTLLEGRMPENPGECLIEADTPGVYGIGDTITLMSGDSDTPTEDVLNTDTFTITGKVSWVKYVDFERGTTTIGNGRVDSYLVIPDEAFAYEYYTDVFMTLEPAKDFDSFSDEYQDYIDEKCDTLENLCRDIHQKRLDDISDEISDAEQELADGEKEYQDGVREFDTKIADAEKEIEDAELEIADAESEIEDAEKKLADGEKEYNEGLDKFNTEISKAEKTIADGEKEYREGVDKFNSEIEKAENDIEDADRKMSDSEKELSAGQKEYDDGLASYNEGLLQIETWKNELTVKQSELEHAASLLPEGSEGMLDTAFAELNDAWQMLNTSQQTLDSSFGELEAARVKLESGWSQLAYGKNELENGRRELETKKSEGLKQLEDAKNKIEDGKKELEKKKTESLKELEDARIKLEDGRKELEDGKKELEDGKKELEDGKKELEEKRADGLKELADAKAEIEDGRAELTDAKEDFRVLCEDLKWYVFDRNSNTGYSSFGDDADRVDSIARIFPIFFILVAALVCLNTMTRMVEEQRTEIGTLKALGYSNGSIISQFLIYAAAASITGSVIGMLIGFNLFPRVIFQAYTLMYDYPPVICSFRWDYAAGCIAASLLCTCAASLSSCIRELTGQPAQLMRPKPPKNGKRVLLEHIPFIWKRLSFNATVTIRNISRYKSRVLMTVIGIGGCTALMLTGFGLRNAISVIVDLQFGEIQKYDAICAFDTDGEDEYNELHSYIESTENTDDVMFGLQKSITVRYDGKIREAYAIVPETPEKLNTFIELRRRLKRNAVHSENDIFHLNDSGVIINEKLAKLMKISEGDEIGFDGSFKTVTVSAITENYSQNYVYFTPDTYAEIFGNPEYNIFWMNLSEGADEDTVSGKILENSSVMAVNFMSNAGKSFRDLIKSLNAIVYVIIGSSGALAFVVLYNLSNINISERMRELATIKVLGFYDNEVASYIYRENTVSSLAGMAAGLFGGIFLNRFVVQTAEVDVVMFYPDIPPQCFIFAALLTLVFTFFVNGILYFKLKDIDMAGSMKAIE